jgi:catechol 2,3-dioxygenase-like lactoylglutathione lyase family enzyme
MEPRISLVTLGVADLARARRFYEEGLGWPVSSSSTESIVFFQAGGLIVSLYDLEVLAKDANLDRVKDARAFGGIALSHNVAERGGVDRLLEEARAAGAEVLKPAHDTFWGGYSGCFADPDGHVWEIAWNPHFTLAEDGSMRLPE